ncbi:MAG TPA: carboxypeptidase regulatory-like domain-containing protein [Terriglobales bacterium]|nr:carboxypeptidase regulatory-like domain-containing protein [Terriglobales bacterium]
MKIWSLALVVVSCTALAQTPAPKEALSVLEGRVVKDPGSLPVKKAEVTLITEGDEERTTYSAITDVEGHFRIEGIRAGRYRAFVERTGMVEVGKRGHRSPGTALTFASGKDVTGIVLHLLPAAVVVGKVLDEDGDPMARVDVSVLRYGYVLGRRKTETAGSATTNDLGEYRVPDLLPGRYMVVVSPTPDFSQEALAPRQNASTKQESCYVTTYYPGTTDRGQAASLDLRAGEETSVNFDLVRVPTYHVRGSVAGSLSLRSSELVIRGNEQDTEFIAAQIDKDGRFEISHLAPGSYTLFVVGGNPDAPLIAQQSIEVTNADLEDVRIVALGSSRVRGSVRVEGVRKVDQSSLLVFLQPSDREQVSHFFAGSDLSVNPMLTKVKADGTFDLKDVPAGSYSVLIEGSARTPDVYLKAVKLGSVDISDSGFTVGGGGTYALEVLLASGAASLDGLVADGDNHAMTDVIVVAVPDGQHAARFDRYGKAITDQHGHFVMSGLTPGDYRVFAFESLEEGAYYDEAFLKPYEARGEKVHLDENGRKTLTLTVIPSAAD